MEGGRDSRRMLNLGRKKGGRKPESVGDGTDGQHEG